MKHSVEQIQQSIPFDGPLFFGGVPEYYSIDATASAVDTNFYGCIGDITVNGKVINLADTDKKPGAILQKCSIEKSSTSFKSSGKKNDLVWNLSKFSKYFSYFHKNIRFF